MAEYVIQHKDVLSFWKDNESGTFDEQKEAITLCFLKKFDLEITDEIKISLKRELTIHFFNNYKQRLNRLPKNKKSFQAFESVHQQWLENEFRFRHIQFKQINTQTRGNYLLYHETHY